MSEQKIKIEDELVQTLLCQLKGELIHLVILTDNPVDEEIDGVVERIENIMKQLKEVFFKDNEALYLFQLSLLYNLSKKYEHLSLETLHQSLSLNPNYCDAWTELGYRNYKLNNINEAEECFLQALKVERKVLPLRNLSIIMRRLSFNEDDRIIHYIAKGIELAKEAVQLDLNDVVSWRILGNAYLSTHQSLHNAKLALAAFTNAEALCTDRSNLSKTLYGKFIACKHCDLYLDSLTTMEQLINLDSFSETPINMKNELVDYLDKVNLYNATNGKIRLRKLRHLKWYLGEMTKIALSRRINVKCIKQLQIGENDGVIFIGRVIWSLSYGRLFPFTFGIMDREAETAVVNLWNLAYGSGVLIGDNVVIPNPVVFEVDFQFGNKNYKYKGIRVDNPLDLVINNKKLKIKDFAVFSVLTNEWDDIVATRSTILADL